MLKKALELLFVVLFVWEGGVHVVAVLLDKIYSNFTNNILILTVQIQLLLEHYYNIGIVYCCMEGGESMEGFMNHSQ